MPNLSNGEDFDAIWMVKNITFYPNNTVTAYNLAGGGCVY
jgi:hypothetical protein